MAAAVTWATARWAAFMPGMATGAADTMLLAFSRGLAGPDMATLRTGAAGANALGLAPAWRALAADALLFLERVEKAMVFDSQQRAGVLGELKIQDLGSGDWGSEGIRP